MIKTSIIAVLIVTVTTFSSQLLAEQSYADLPFEKAVEERSKRLANTMCESNGTRIGLNIAKEAQTTQDWEYVGSQLNQFFGSMSDGVMKTNEPKNTKDMIYLSLQYMTHLTDIMIQDERFRLVHDADKTHARTYERCMRDLPSILLPVAENAEKNHRKTN